MHPREVDDHFSHGSVTELLGWLVLRHHASAGRDALPRPAARGAARRAASGSTPPTSTGRGRSMPRSAGRGSTRWSTRPSESTRRCPDASLSSLVRRLRYAAPQWSGELTSACSGRNNGSRTRESTASTGTGRPVRTRRAHGDGFRASAGSVRPGRVGPPPLRAAVGLGLPLRGVYAGVQTPARLLCAAAALARPRHRLGQSLGGQRRAPTRPRLRRGRRRAIEPFGASSTRSSIGCESFLGLL